MTITQLIEKLSKFPPDAKVLVFNGNTLCAVECLTQHNDPDDPDHGAVVIYLEA